MEADGHLLLVLHAPPISPSRNRVARLFWRDADGNWKSNELGNGIAALGKHLEEYDAIIAALDHKEEAAETAAEYFAVLERLAPLLRSATAILDVDLATLAALLGQKPDTFQSGGIVQLLLFGLVFLALAFGVVLTIIVAGPKNSRRKESFDREIESFKKLRYHD